MISHLGRYEITGELGRGAMGVVYKAYDPLIERVVAIKTINLQTLSEAEKTEYEARFYQEAKAAGRLSHPNIVTIYDLGESDNVAYIVMELLAGCELQEILYRKTHLLITDALNMAIQAASGLYYAHQRGVVHGDVKPANIMVLDDGQVKIADFGIAKLISVTETLKEEAIFGTPSFMSPEQIQGKPIDARADIFSLGVVLYYMLTDRLPFPEEDDELLKHQLVHTEPEKACSLNPAITAELDAVIHKCLAKDPDDRYKNANDLANDLTDCLAGLEHAHAAAEQPAGDSIRFKRLKSVVSPRSFTQRLTTHGSYFAMFTMVLITMIDLVTPDTIQMNLLYLFPLVVIALHCERIGLIGAAVSLALVLQGIHLVLDDIPVSSKIVLALMIVVSDIAIVFLARLARINFIEVEQLSAFDSLTKLRNRSSFAVVADVEINRHKRKNAVLSFVYIDLHQLKELNRSRGYAAGDKAVRLVARAIRENIRQHDTASRIGGDEFAILMPETGAADCATFCTELAGKIAGKLEAASLAISINIGHVSFPHPPASVSEIFDAGEGAMHRAKTSGKSFAVSD